jgi:hypothetical protein
MENRIRLWTGNLMFAELYKEALEQNDVPVMVSSEGLGVGYLGGSTEATLWLMQSEALDDPDKLSAIRNIIPPEQLLLEPPLA